jgi:4-amino-4-deoxy-L-arabinose transferase-like glycosyltransferase
VGGLGYVPTAFRPPLYPLIVAACSLSDGAELQLLATVHVILGAATVALVFLIAERWQLSARGALFAAALVAIDPILLRQSVLPMTETLAAFLAALSLLVLTIAGNRLALCWVGSAGIILAAAELCRPTFLVWMFLCGLVFVGLAVGLRRRLILGSVFALSAALVIGPWAVRNYREFHKPIITTTHGGYTLYLANNHFFYDHLYQGGWFTPWDADPLVLADPFKKIEGIVELERDHALYDSAVGDIRAQPGIFLVACVYRLSRLWGVCPLATDPQESVGHRTLRYAVAMFYLCEFALAAWGAWLVGRNWLRSPWLWGLLLVLSFTAVHTFYWTDMRMRAPFIAVIALAAGAALSGKAFRAGEQPLAAQEVANTPPASNLP